MTRAGEYPVLTLATAAAGICLYYALYQTNSLEVSSVFGIMSCYLWFMLIFTSISLVREYWAGYRVSLRHLLSVELSQRLFAISLLDYGALFLFMRTVMVARQVDGNGIAVPESPETHNSTRLWILVCLPVFSMSYLSWSVLFNSILISTKRRRILICASLQLLFSSILVFAWSGAIVKVLMLNGSYILSSIGTRFEAEIVRNNSMLLSETSVRVVKYLQLLVLLMTSCIPSVTHSNDAIEALKDLIGPWRTIHVFLLVCIVLSALRFGLTALFSRSKISGNEALVCSTFGVLTSIIGSVSFFASLSVSQWVQLSAFLVSSLGLFWATGLAERGDSHMVSFLSAFFGESETNTPSGEEHHTLLPSLADHEHELVQVTPSVVPLAVVGIATFVLNNKTPRHEGHWSLRPRQQHWHSIAYAWITMRNENEESLLHGISPVASDAPSASSLGLHHGLVGSPMNVQSEQRGAPTLAGGPASSIVLQCSDSSI